MGKKQHFKTEHRKQSLENGVESTTTRISGEFRSWNGELSKSKRENTRFIPYITVQKRWKARFKHHRMASTSRVYLKLWRATSVALKCITSVYIYIYRFVQILDLPPTEQQWKVNVGPVLKNEQSNLFHCYWVGVTQICTVIYVIFSWKICAFLYQIIW